jgi:DNA-binding NtrC family response regulator
MKPPDPPHRVLVVDDDDDFRKVLIDLLHLNGFECRSAANAAEALAFLEAESFDLAIYDIVMPGMSGRELAVATREVAPDMRLVALSALVCSPELMDFGFDVALQKPFDIKRLLNICRKYATLSRRMADERARPDPPSTDAPRH